MISNRNAGAVEAYHLDEFRGSHAKLLMAHLRKYTRAEKGDTVAAAATLRVCPIMIRTDCSVGLCVSGARSAPSFAIDGSSEERASRRYFTMIIYSVGGGWKGGGGGPNISWRQEERGEVCVGIR